MEMYEWRKSKKTILQLNSKTGIAEKEAKEFRDSAVASQPSTGRNQPSEDGRFAVAEANRGAAFTPPATPGAGTTPDLPDLPG